MSEQLATIHSSMLWDKALTAQEMKQVNKVVVEAETWEDALERLHELGIYPRTAILGEGE